MHNTLKFLDIDKQLLKEQLNLNRKLKIKNYIKLIDSYIDSLSLPKKEIFSAKINYAEQLSSDLTLPLKVKGVFLSEGRPKRKYYSAVELRRAAESNSNSSFRIMQDHRENETSTIVGKVTRIEYDEGSRLLLWWGHINSELTARNILDGTITDVSVTVYSREDWTDADGLVGKDLEFSELSTVVDGAEDKNSIVVDR